MILYQIQTKFRDEVRPRGGLIRLREFIMKDAYSFDADWDALDANYHAACDAYERIFNRCGVPTIPVHADSGAIGGKDSQEFMYLTDVGEDTSCSARTAATRRTRRRPTTRSASSQSEDLAPARRGRHARQEDDRRARRVPRRAALQDAEGGVLRGERRAGVRRDPRRPRSERGEAAQRAEDRRPDAAR